MIITIKASERHSYLKKAYYNKKGILNRNENILAKEIDTLMPDLELEYILVKNW